MIRVERKGAGNEVKLEADGKFVEGNIILLPSEGTKEVRVNAKVS